MVDRELTRLLFVGDMHLGRVSGRIPPGLAVTDLDPRAAWRLTVAAASEHDVQAVVLAGDVVDGINDRFEAFGPLSAGVRTLLEDGIRVLAVAGNHDGRALPQLADLVPGFELLGRGGRWETTEVTGPGGPVRISGWSFPAEHHTGDPLAIGPPPPGDGIPSLGVLHCELDTAGGRYAPTTTASLLATGYQAWLLGHEHRPTLDPERPGPGYLGSLVGLDPTETGPHGPWLVGVGAAGVWLRMLPLAPLRWEVLEIDAGRFDPTAQDLTDLVLAAVAGEAARSELTGARAVGFRVRLTGRTRHLAALSESVAALSTDQLVTEDGGRVLFVDQIRLDALADHDLHLLAESDDPAGVLASHLLRLQRTTGGELTTAARDEIRRVDIHFAGLDPREPAPSDAELRDWLIAAGQRALDALLAHREDTGGTA